MLRKSVQKLTLCLSLTLFSIAPLAQVSLNELLHANPSEIPANKRIAIGKMIELSEATSPQLDPYTVATDMLLSMGVEYGEAYNFMIDEFAARIGTLQKQLKELQYSVWHEAFTLEELNELIDFSETPQGTQTMALVFEVQELITLANFEAMNALQMSFAQPLDSKAFSNQQTQNQTPSMKAQIDAALNELDGSECSNADQLEKATPLVRLPPIYPLIARQHSINGWVELEFDVTELGTAENIWVTKSHPGTLFNHNAAQAVERYIYCKGKRYDANTIRIVFEMAR